MTEVVVFFPGNSSPRLLPRRSFHTQVRTDKNNTVYAFWVNIKDEKPQIFLAHRQAGAEQWSRIYQLSDGTQNALYPMLALDDTQLYVVWTEKKGETSQVKVRTASLTTS